MFREDIVHAFVPPNENTWFHNEDFSGDVKILVHKSSIKGQGALAMVSIPFEDILALVHKYQQGQSDQALGALLIAEYKTEMPGSSGAIRRRQFEFYTGRDVPGDVVAECHPTLTTDPDWECSSLAGREQKPETD